MKRKKNVTAAVLVANAANSKSSTGPTTPEGKATSSRNSLRHGLLSQAVFLESNEKRAEYQAELQKWVSHFNPQGPLELHFVEDIANIRWKLSIEESLETKELWRRQHGLDGIDGVFASELGLPLEASDLPLDQSWFCERVSIQALASKNNLSSHGESAPKVHEGRFLQNTRQSAVGTLHRTGQLGVHAVFGNSLDSLARYRVGLKHELRHAIRDLRSTQKERLEQESDDGSL